MLGVFGIYLEGLYIVLVCKGMYDVSKFCVFDVVEIVLVVLLDNGVMLLMLVLEWVLLDSICVLVEWGVVVVVGYIVVSYEEVCVGLEVGICGFIYLYNVMLFLIGCELGVVGVVLEDCDSWVGIIVDGVYVYLVSLCVVLVVKLCGKVMLVIDVMLLVGVEDFSYVLYGEVIIVVDGVVCNVVGLLVGLVLDMVMVVCNVV